MYDLSQAMVKLSCVTDDTCCRVHNTLQSVSDRLRGSGKYSIALVNAGGHECVNKCGRVKSDEIVTPSRRGVGKCSAFKHAGL